MGSRSGRSTGGRIRAYSAKTCPFTRLERRKSLDRAVPSFSHAAPHKSTSLTRRIEGVGAQSTKIIVDPTHLSPRLNS
jgi:hypothetical protein